MMGFIRASVAQGLSRPHRAVGGSDLRAQRLVAASARFDNPIGCHALCWTGGWDSADAFKAIQGSKAAGFSFVEVPLLDPETVDAQMTRGLLEEHEMSATSSLGLTFDADISSEDAEVVERGKQLLFKALEKTQGMGATVMCGVIFSALGKYPGPATVQGRANCVRSLKELAVRAQDAGVVLGLEYVNRYETNVVNTAAQTMEMIADIGMDNVKVHLDTYHANIEEVSIASAIRACGTNLGYVHIGESHRGYLGTGSIDWKAVFQALADCHYKGPIAFESFSSRIVSPTLSNTLCVWRDLWEDSTDLAEQAHSFIAAHLNSAHRRA